jgi:hypothetical protein
VESGLWERLTESPWAELKEQVGLGGEEFLAQLHGRVAGNPREQVGVLPLQGQPSLPQIIRLVEQIKGERWEEFVNRRGDWGRDLALYLGRTRCRMKLAELGRAVGGLDYSSVSSAVSRLAAQAARDPELAEAVRRAVPLRSNPKM